MFFNNSHIVGCPRHLRILARKAVAAVNTSGIYLCVRALRSLWETSAKWSFSWGPRACAFNVRTARHRRLEGSCLSTRPRPAGEHPFPRELGGGLGHLSPSPPSHRARGRHSVTKKRRELAADCMFACRPERVYFHIS